MKIKVSRCGGGSFLNSEFKEYHKKHEQEMKEKGITYKDEAKRIFKEIGIDLETELIEYY